jgi:DNA-binding NtrC family response regulator
MDLPLIIEEAAPADATIEVVYERHGGRTAIASVRVGPPHDASRGVPTLADMERVHIAAALVVTGGKRAPAARMLGISERNLYRKIRRHNIGA